MSSSRRSSTSDDADSEVSESFSGSLKLDIGLVYLLPLIATWELVNDFLGGT